MQAVVEGVFRVWIERLLDWAKRFYWPYLYWVNTHARGSVLMQAHSRHQYQQGSNKKSSRETVHYTRPNHPNITMKSSG
ncbi:hypothetical protein MPLB_1510037 [Mesorhizobium sp. ORS 3324]|nr:hypothetical protein MPLB_1510037 [Mesorhizobium sp. ORS 3324]